MSAITIYCNPFDLIMQAYNNLYNKPCKVEFVSGLTPQSFPFRLVRLFRPTLGPWGNTLFPEDGGIPVVSIDSLTPFEAVIEIIGHELAHVAVGAGCADDHGLEWETAFEAINQEFTRLFKEVQG